MLPLLIDTHAHLDDEQFAGQVEAVLQRATAAGVGRILAIGTTASSSLACVRLAQEHRQVWASVGIQPNYVADAQDEDWKTIVGLSEEDRVVAIGETGLDWYWDHTPIKLQREYFERHLRLARQTGLPIVVHMREASDSVGPRSTDAANPQTCCEDIYRSVAAAARAGINAETASDPEFDQMGIRGVMHSYTGSFEMANRFCQLGFYISFAGMVTFKKSNELREVASQVPSDRLLIETDSPYLSPEPKRGKRPNEPSFVAFTAECLSKTRGQSIEELARMTTQNAMQLFWREESECALR